MNCHRVSPQSLAACALVLAYDRTSSGYALGAAVSYETGQAVPLGSIAGTALHGAVATRVVRFVPHDMPASAALSEMQASEWAIGNGFVPAPALLYRDAPALETPHAIAVLVAIDAGYIARFDPDMTYRKFVGSEAPSPDKSLFDSIVWCDDHLTDSKTSRIEDRDGQLLYGPSQRALRQAMWGFSDLYRFSADFHVPDRDVLSKSAAWRCNTEPSGSPELDLLRVVLQPSKIPPVAGYNLVSAKVIPIDDTHYRLFVEAVVLDTQKLKAEAQAERERVTGSTDPVRLSSTRAPQSVEQHLHDVLIACNEDPDFAKFGVYHHASRFGSADSTSVHARVRFLDRLQGENGAALRALFALVGVLLRADQDGAIRAAIHDEGCDTAYGSAVFDALEKLGDDGVREVAHRYDLDLAFVLSQMKDD